VPVLAPTFPASVWPNLFFSYVLPISTPARRPPARPRGSRTPRRVIPSLPPSPVRKETNGLLPPSSSFLPPVPNPTSNPTVISYLGFAAIMLSCAPSLSFLVNALGKYPILTPDSLDASIRSSRSTRALFVCFLVVPFALQEEAAFLFEGYIVVLSSFPSLESDACPPSPLHLFFSVSSQQSALPSICRMREECSSGRRCQLMLPYFPLDASPQGTGLFPP